MRHDTNGVLPGPFWDLSGNLFDCILDMLSYTVWNWAPLRIEVRIWSAFGFRSAIPA
jgi:hypothetical protein